mgnify:CR=1 FL=1
MRSLVVDEKGSLSIRTLPVPVPGDCQALVRLCSCGVCNGTDSKLIHHTFKNFDSYPAALGHEGVGEVVQLGPKCTSLRLGDRVLLPFLEGAVEGVSSGWGAFSEYALVGDAEACALHGMGEGTPRFNEGYLAQTVLSPDDRVDDVEAVMIVTFREVLSAIRRFGIAPNSDVVVFGCGPVGMCFIRFLRLLGMRRVIAVDISDSKVEKARSMGATAAFNSTKVNVAQAIRTLLPEGADAVVDAVGINALINQAMGLIRYNGKICCYGISPKLSMELDWSCAPYNWSLNFVQWPSKREEAQAHAQIMAWINMGVLSPSAFISHVFPFDRILDAFALLDQRLPDTQKIVVQF